MTVDEVLQACAQAGVTVTADGDRLHVRRADGAPLPPDLLAALRAHKAVLLAILTSRPTWSATGRSWHCPCGASVIASWHRCPCCGTSGPAAAAPEASAPTRRCHCCRSTVPDDGWPCPVCHPRGAAPTPETRP